MFDKPPSHGSLAWAESSPIWKEKGLLPLKLIDKNPRYLLSVNNMI